MLMFKRKHDTRLGPYETGAMVEDAVSHASFDRHGALECLQEEVAKLTEIVASVAQLLPPEVQRALAESLDYVEVK